MKKILFLLTILFCYGCKINQTIDGKREGKWVFKSTSEDTIYYQKGRYKNGIESGTWKSYENNKLVCKEKYKGKKGYMINYYPNGKVESEGPTQIEETPKGFRWNLTGDWNYYDSNGKLYLSRVYLNGQKISEQRFE